MSDMQMLQFLHAALAVKDDRRAVADTLQRLSPAEIRPPVIGGNWASASLAYRPEFDQESVVARLLSLAEPNRDEAPPPDLLLLGWTR